MDTSASGREGGRNRSAARATTGLVVPRDARLSQLRFAHVILLRGELLKDEEEEMQP